MSLTRQHYHSCNCGSLYACSWAPVCTYTKWKCKALTVTFIHDWSRWLLLQYAKLYTSIIIPHTVVGNFHRSHDQIFLSCPTIVGQVYALFLHIYIYIYIYITCILVDIVPNMDYGTWDPLAMVY